MLCGMATLHGLANLVLEEKAANLFRSATAKIFLGEYLPPRRVGPHEGCFQ